MILSVPIGAAEWGGRGFYEPDTQIDKSSGFMFENPDTDPGTRSVYFSAYVSNSYTGGNPNAAGSNFLPFPTRFHAFLGVWEDCNRDGYIGTQEGALLEYRSELLFDGSVCAPQASAHNDGQWVQEFLWIGPDHPALCEDGETLSTNEENDTNPYNIHDGCARIWADIGLPEDGGQVTCPVTPLPRGTLQSTGGAIRYTDCITNYRIYETSVLLDDLVPEEGLGIQLGFGDNERENPQKSESVFNQKNPYGDPAGESMVSVWDCSAEGTPVADPTGGDLRRVAVHDPTGVVPDEVAGRELKNYDGSLVAVNGTDDDGNVVTVHVVKVPSVDPSGSPAGTVNDTLEGSPDVGALANDGDCDREEGIGEESDVYEWVEDDFEPSAPLRTDHDFYFNFIEGNRGSGAVADQLGASTPGTLGLGVNREGVVGVGRSTPFWFSNPGMLASRNGFVSLDDGSPKPAQHFTFYGFLSASAIVEHNLVLAATGAATYGSEHCAGNVPITGAWACDPEDWWRDANDKSIKTDWQVTVGQSYNLFDVDCYDETYVRDQPVTSSEITTKTRCAR